LNRILLDQEVQRLLCYEFNYEDGTCPNLIDTDGDGVADTPYYNPYANSEYNKRVSIGGNIKVEGSFQLYLDFLL